MKRPTLRRIMLAVALAAILLWGNATWRRGQVYRQQAIAFAHFEKIMLDAQKPDDPHLSAQAEYVGQMRRKYEHAARRPWIVVEPDPPVPR